MAIRMDNSGYIEGVYNSPDAFKCTVDSIGGTLYDIIQRSTAKIDALVFRGTSGAALGYPLAYRLGIPPVYVRKENENSHGRVVEGPSINIENYIIIDDFISSGRTVNTIVERMLGAVCKLIVLYNRSACLDSFRGIPVICPLKGFTIESQQFFSFCPPDETAAVKPQ